MTTVFTVDANSSLNSHNYLRYIQYLNAIGIRAVKDKSKFFFSVLQAIHKISTGGYKVKH